MSLKSFLSRETILGNYFEIGPVVKDDKLFKYISYLELMRTFNSAERNQLSNVCSRHHAEQFVEIVLNLDKWFRRRCRFGPSSVTPVVKNICLIKYVSVYSL